MHSPFGEVERTASRSLPALRFGHLCTLIVLGLAMLDLLTLGREHPHAWAMIGRNLAGFTGLAFLTGPWLGGRLSWVLPFAYGVVALIVGRGDIGQFAWWVWPLQAPADRLALGIALVLLAAGLIAAVLFGARDVQGEVT